MRRAAVFLLILGMIGASNLSAQELSDQAADEAAIRKTVASYMEAFNKHDAKALADHWSPDAVYLNRSTGEEVTGRDAIAEQFTAQFKEQSELKLEINVSSIQFISPNVAVEQGTAKLISSNGDPEE